MSRAQVSTRPPHTVDFSFGGLDASTTYHYRLVAVNANGTTNGADQTFPTSTGVLPPANTAPLSVFFTSSGALGTTAPVGSRITAMRSRHLARRTHDLAAASAGVAAAAWAIV